MPGAAVRIASAPGRVTILGEHTDYNCGVALALATEQRTTVRLTPRDDGIVRVDSDACGSAAGPIGTDSGPAFLRLAAALVADAGLGGAGLAVSSTVPIGVGVSSSAAFAVAVALAAGITGDPGAVARRCQAAERLAGADVGTLDQLVALAGQRGRVVDLDFSTGSTATFELHAAIGLTVVDSGVPRTVAATPYGERRAECAAAERLLGPLGLASERDAATLVDPTLRRRARHVASECRRVREARGALATGDLSSLGTLLDEGHASLRDDFEASSGAVEQCRDALRGLPGVAGVRLVGAGFGGSLLVAHDPDVAVGVPGRFFAVLRGGEGAVRLR